MMRSLTAAVLCTAAVSALGGCSGAVEVQPLPGATAAACVELTWPTTVGGHPRVTTTPQAAAHAAWGDPAIIARCGAAALAPTEEPCVDVDGVGWIPEKLSDGTRFTTFGTDPAIELLVPSTYAPESLLLPAFTKAAKGLPANGLECR